MGCSESPYDLAAVKGKVLIDGQPFTAGKLQFAPVERGGANAGKPAFGLLDSEGNFELGTYGERDGAIVGQHWVTLMSLPDRRTAADGGIPNFRRLPAQKTPVEVLAGEQNEFVIELTLDQIREYAE